MRGKLWAVNATQSAIGNIPAYAGKTVWPEAKNVLNKEHPRVCGENTLAADAAIPQIGTSPRMRGKPTEAQALIGLGRNIPAYAGKTG